MSEHHLFDSSMIRQTGKSLSAEKLMNAVIDEKYLARRTMEQHLLATCRLSTVPDTYRNVTDEVLERFESWMIKFEIAWNSILKEPIGNAGHIHGFLAMISVWNFPTVNKAMEILLDVRNTPNVIKSDATYLVVSFMAGLNDILSLGIMYPDLKIVEYFDLVTPAYENSLFVLTERGAGLRIEEALRLVGLTQPKLSKLLYRVAKSKLDYGQFISLMQRFAGDRLEPYVQAVMYRSLDLRSETGKEYQIELDAFDFHLWSRANQWRDKISTVLVNEEDGTTIRVHHHTAFWYVSKNCELNNKVHYGGTEQSMRELVNNFDPKSSPKRFYADIVKNIAQATYEKYNGMVFADFSEVLRNEVDGIRYIPTALEVLKEGDVMGHCVGGEGYVSGCVEGDTLIFHVDSSECPYGLTIALNFERWSNRSITDEGYDHTTDEFFIAKEGISYRLTTIDFTGRKNREVTRVERYSTYSKLCKVFGIEMNSPSSFGIALSMVERKD
jgi:hypothetical protein